MHVPEKRLITRANWIPEKQPNPRTTENRPGYFSLVKPNSSLLLMKTGPL